MKTKRQNCLLRTDLPGEDPAAPPLDPRTRSAFRDLRLNREDLALGLAVRLRVLGKSLAAGCQEPGHPLGRKNLAYKALRLQLDEFMEHFIGRGRSERHGLPAVRNYLLDLLPRDLSGCTGTPCCLDLVERTISLLSESTCENNDWSGDLIASYSL